MLFASMVTYRYTYKFSRLLVYENICFWICEISCSLYLLHSIMIWSLTISSSYRRRDRSMSSFKLVLLVSSFKLVLLMSSSFNIVLLIPSFNIVLLMLSFKLVLLTSCFRLVLVKSSFRLVSFISLLMLVFDWRKVTFNRQKLRHKQNEFEIEDFLSKYFAFFSEFMNKMYNWFF